MDCNSKTISKVLLVLLLLPSLIWGYGKAMVRLAQNGVSTSLGFEDTKSNGSTKSNAPLSPAQIKGKAVGKKTNPSSGLTTTTPVPDRSPGIEVSPNTHNTKIEPELSIETYNQVRAKKPSIPSRFDGSIVSADYSANENGFGQVSLLGLIGIPTLVFSVLFFVMWGIISGKIQRIMF